MLFIGEEVGTGSGPSVDIAVDPLEGTTICAKALPDSLAVLAMAEGGSLLHSPDIYMNKIAVGPGYPEGIVDLDASPADNLDALAKAKGCKVQDLTACILDRARHGELISNVREAGAGVKLIGDGDIAGIIHTANPYDTGIDIYMGVGGAPEGVLAAAALRCIGGQIQTRLHPLASDDAKRVAAMGIEDINRKYNMNDLARGDVIFSATGVTDGSMLKGVHFGRTVKTHTVVMRSATKTVRWISTEHQVRGADS
jgi:fructose-1,6-bisphosphatase II / sedoheptulose-1,7-bisphosphatase